MTIERWTHKLYDGSIEEGVIEYNGIDYLVYVNHILQNIYKSYTWAKKSLEKYGFECVETKIILG